MYILFCIPIKKVYISQGYLCNSSDYLGLCNRILITTLNCCGAKAIERNTNKTEHGSE